MGSDVKLSTCPRSVESTRPSGCCVPARVRLRSATSSRSRSASPTSSSTLPRAPATATPSRRRTSWNVWPSPTDKQQTPLSSYSPPQHPNVAANEQCEYYCVIYCVLVLNTDVHLH